MYVVYPVEFGIRVCVCSGVYASACISTCITVCLICFVTAAFEMANAMSLLFCRSLKHAQMGWHNKRHGHDTRNVILMAEINTVKAFGVDLAALNVFRLSL